MKIQIDEDIIKITLSEEEADKIKAIDSEAHEYFKDNNKEIIINKK